MKITWKKKFLDIFNDQQALLILNYRIKEVGKVLKELESPILSIGVVKSTINEIFIQLKCDTIRFFC